MHDARINAPGKGRLIRANAHESLCYKKARQYDGSMHEWTKDAKRPVTTARE
jgi:3-mercaptopyruvate sulfurtransferase SseA